jgi:GNAT superfamily N-acetyltransferase
MPDFNLRIAQPSDRSEVAELICVSTNYWYQRRGAPPLFPRGPETTDVFWQVYEALDPGCCVVAEHQRSGRLMGSCYFHPREHHVSLGIMNVHPNYFGRGVAHRLLKYITDYADQRGYPAVRLVQSAMNLDSFSLYTRSKFVPRVAYQDMLMRVPEEGLSLEVVDAARIRAAKPADVSAMVELELEVSGIARPKDFRYFLENHDKIWDGLVYEGPGARVEGFMFSCTHPAMSMIGPGVARTQEQATSLVLTALDRYRGASAVFLVPVECDEMVQRMYQIGASNCELHFSQVRGRYQPLRGVSMPVFLPESA